MNGDIFDKILATMVGVAAIWLGTLGLILTTDKWWIEVSRPDCGTYTVNQHQSGDIPQACVGETE